MRSRVIQSNLTKGAISPTLHGRIDTETYTQGLKTAENVVIMPHGGVRRRGGMQKITDNYVSASSGRIEPFVFSRTESYLMLFTNNQIEIFFGGVSQATVVSTYTTAELYDLDIIQSADTVIITHEDHAPAKLVRGATHANWTLSDITIVGMPQYVYDTVAEDVWSVTRGWPRTCTFHIGRLWFGGSKSKVNSVWGSVAGDIFNFAIGSGADDDAIFDTIDTDTFNEINGIVSAGSLQVFTRSQEFYNTGGVITPSSSGWVSFSSNGAKRIRPLFLNGATLFVDSTARTLRQAVFNDTEQSFNPINISMLSDHLLNDVVSLEAIKGTTADFSDLVFLVNGDGTVAVLNTLRNEGIQGWTQWTTDGLFKDVAVVDKSVYFLIERGGNLFIEVLQEGTYSDHNTKVEGTPPTVDNVVFGLDNVTLGGDNVVFQDPTTGVTITSVTTDINDLLAYSQYWRVVADGSVMASALPTNDGVDLNHFDIGRNAYTAEVGLDYPVTIETLPLNIATKSEGYMINLEKRVNRVILRLYESLGVKVQDTIMNDRRFIVTLDKAPVPFTGIKEVRLLGYGRLVEVTISQDDPLPLTLLSIDTEVEV